MSGIICANFGIRSFGNWTCRVVWHGKCYTEKPGVDFPYMVASDLDGSLIDDNAMAEDDERRFREARDGDSLIVPFQCDTCNFLNIRMFW